MRVRPHDIAHARTGDKGDPSTLSVFPYRDERYAGLVREPTPEVLRRHLADHVQGAVIH
ncbi:hypothetical protein SAMN04489712_14820 [Thermomonospora echinospora]|uniref:AtuA-like ferredoxin-fold domain-containing protein n=1 Tax=Thermomonospora echinospora TaxID=1992 RepID=A0A1H6EBB5_9ACTN|nr:hypothetical protein [Thermomonospora echinospora]SEG94551.1 hypothetical protein SAMN04489712_14820 [Thermomonospora echinospora]